jgi:hypothetical protein
MAALTRSQAASLVHRHLRTTYKLVWYLARIIPCSHRHQQWIQRGRRRQLGVRQAQVQIFCNWMA